MRKLRRSVAELVEALANQVRYRK